MLVQDTNTHGQVMSQAINLQLNCVTAEIIRPAAFMQGNIQECTTDLISPKREDQAGGAKI